MSPSPREILRLQVQAVQLSEILASPPGEIVQQLIYGLVRTSSHLRKSVKRIKDPSFAILQDDLGSHHPVSALPHDQVTQNVNCAPGISSFVAPDPAIGQPAQQRV